MVKHDDGNDDKADADHEYHDCYHDHTTSDCTAACLSLGEGDTVVMMMIIMYVIIDDDY